MAAPVPVSRPRQLRMQVDSIDESQVYVWNACFCCYDGCVPGCHIGCAEQKTILCLECDCCCKTKTPALRCICCDLRCVDVSVCCKQQDQNCCCVSAWAIPPDHSVPFMLSYCFVQCIPKLGVLQRVAELRSMRLP
ncbi:unnamed protein product [Durusdinium trenchii]|uniref:Uncharacterized protein n=2 Tax=Durusdinium trenchii TaxID=1381693 RepID=A0ABP0L6N0_9DINO